MTTFSMPKRMEAWRDLYQNQLSGSESSRKAAEEFYLNQFPEGYTRNSARSRMNFVLSNLGHGTGKAKEIETRVKRINEVLGVA